MKDSEQEGTRSVHIEYVQAWIGDLDWPLVEKVVRAMAGWPDGKWTVEATTRSRIRR